MHRSIETQESQNMYCYFLKFLIDQDEISYSWDLLACEISQSLVMANNLYFVI